MLQMHRVVELETAFDAGDNFRACLENVVHIVTSIELPGVVNELFATQLLDFIELGAFLFEFFGDAADELINALLRSLGVQDNQALVLAIHLPFVLVISFETEC